MIRDALRRMLNVSRDDSFIIKVRRKRIAFFRELTAPLPKPVRILDVGGTALFWEKMGLAGDPDYLVTILNLYESESIHPNITIVVGDAIDMREYEDGSFDVAFSNSVIEHVGGPDEQRRMAEEVIRIARRYFVQTPSRSFPFEPHFLFPFFQFFPLALKVFLIRHFSIGWIPKIPDKVEATRAAKSVRLLNRSEIEDLFPGGEIYEEKLFGLTSSFIVRGGW